MRILIAGCGDIGTRTGLRFAARGHEVFGLRRDPTGLPRGIQPVAADLSVPSSLEWLPADVDVCVITTAADGRTEDAYRTAYVTGTANLLDALAGSSPSLQRLLFTSSTAVYGDMSGAWIDEDSPTEPSSFSGRLVLEGEQLIRTSATPIRVVLRLGGIYGPGRTRLLDQVRRGEAAIPSDPAYTNRIHADDAAAALVHLSLNVDAPDEVYLGVDDDPAERGEVIAFLAGLLDAPIPPKGDSGTRGNKRCRNDRLRSTGFEFGHPTYREGYTALVAAERSDAKAPSTPSQPPT